MSARQVAVLRFGALAMVAAGVLLLLVPGALGDGDQRVRLHPDEPTPVPDAGLFAPAHVTLFAAGDADVAGLGCEVRQPNGEPSSAELFAASPFDRTIEIGGAVLQPVLKVRAPTASTMRCTGEALTRIEPLYLARRSSSLPVGWLRGAGVTTIAVGIAALIALRGSRARR